MRTILLLFCLMLCLSPTAYAQSDKDIKQASKLFNEAEKSYNNKDYEEALASYSESFRLSKNAAILFNMGQCYRQLGREQEALDTYKDYLVKDPNSTIRSTVEGFIKELEDKNTQKQAEKIFNDAEQQYKLLNYDKALEGYKEVYLLIKEPSLLFNIGQCYRQLGRKEEALKSYKAFLRDYPNSPERAGVEALIKSLEEDGPTEKKPKKGPSKALLFGGIGGVGLSGALGGFALLQARQANTNVENGEAADGKLLFERAQTLGFAADALLLLGAGSAVAGLVLRGKEKAPVALAPIINKNHSSAVVVVRF